MTARLPVVGDDGDSWGTILNEFLSVAHHEDGTVRKEALQQAGAVTAINGKTATDGAVTLTATDIGTQAAAWQPEDNGFKAVSIDLAAFNSYATPVAGMLYVFRLPVRAATTFQSVSLAVRTPGAGASMGSYVGLYDASGKLLGKSADIGTLLTKDGEAQCQLTSACELNPGFVYSAFLINMATPPVLYLAGNVYGQMLNIGLSANAPNTGTLNGMGNSLPASISLADLAAPYGVFFMGAK